VPELSFDVLGARAERYSLVPTLTLRIHVGEATGVAVHAIALRCQIRIEPRRRRYTDDEANRLVDLFGEAPRWAETLKPMQLATVSVMVPGFTGDTDAVVPVPCSYDLEIASTRYFRALDDGTVGLLLLFSGTAFLENGTGYAVEQLPWTAESRYRLPVAVWRDMVERDFPNAAWLRCSRETLDALGRYRTRHALPSWEHTLEALLSTAT
jgi:hypothetical protein